MPRFSFLLLLGLLTAAPAFGQGAVSDGPGDTMRPANNPHAYTPAAQRLADFQQRQQRYAASPLKNVPIRNVGPTIMSGRVSDVEANPADPTHFYVGYASGGVWYTDNNGASFTPLFDDQETFTIGDVAVDWANNIVWVGTGESNSSRSSYAGTGMYKSTDGGDTWQHLGLAETHHIGRVIAHPTDTDVALVAAVGHLYSPNAERGIYKTSDGGRTWQKTLFVDNDTGAIDLVRDPSNPDVVYAAMWHRTRRAWDFVEAGASSGIYKSTDGGDTWQRITTANSGFPTGAGVGRIGLDVAADGTVFAILDNQFRRPDEDEPADDDAPAVTRDNLRTMTRQQFLALAQDDVADYLRRERFPSRYTVESVVAMVEAGDLEPLALVEYLEDANARLFNTPVIGAEVYRSEDGGRTWTKTHDDYLNSVYNSYGYYFGQLRVSPLDRDKLYIMGVPILRSDDGGATWTNINGDNVHVDHHALWVSPTREAHIINGNDGGINVSYDDGAHWFKMNAPALGQFYAVAYDMAEPYNVYGGLQDNGVWMGPSTYTAGDDWHGEGRYPYERLYGGDGMQVQVDLRTNDLVYTGLQFGNYARIDRGEGGRAQSIKPQHELGDRPLRFNWQTPILLSRHNQDILYFGTNRLFRSFDRGETFHPISDDLTQGGQPGDVPYGTLAAIDESPLRFGLIYAGSDDGLLHGTRDGGVTWQRLSDRLPNDLWISHVDASAYDEGTVYVSLNGYRWDDFRSYLYKSTNYGQTWTKIGANLPLEPINVVHEDPHNANLIYVGTDMGLYASLDGGQTFEPLATDMPHVPVHDLEVQPRENDLIVGTHGRSLWIADVAHLQTLTPEVMAQGLQIFELDDVAHNARWGFSGFFGTFEPSIEIAFYAPQGGAATVSINAEDGTTLRAFSTTADAGLNYLAYDLAADAESYNAWLVASGEDAAKPADNGTVYLQGGTYTVEIAVGGNTATQELTITQRRNRRPVPLPTPGEEEGGK